MKNLMIATAATVALMASVTTAQADGQKTYGCNRKTGLYCRSRICG